MILPVTDHLFRGPRPTDFATLKAAGIDLAIDLEEGWYDAFHPDARDEYVRQASEADVLLRCFPLSDILAPPHKTVANVLAAVDAALGSGLGVYVHCLHGEDRTGYVCAAYRIGRMGWTFDAAVSEMFGLGFHRVPYGFWVEGLKDYARPAERQDP